MCGICGRLNFSSETLSAETIQKMNGRMLHRGPDEEGLYLSPEKNVGLGIRRLKIIDLSTGSQPIFNENKEIVVVLNGEIYNYIELRQELEAKGHVFSTRSDTETIVHAYEVYGLDFLSQLNGMFGIALWDNQKKILIVARDRSGIKPMYYWRNERGIAFASELKSLMADPHFPKEIDPFALDDYFSLMYVPGPQSIFKAVKKLEPGHFLLCDFKKKTVENKTYWQKIPKDEPKNLGWENYRKKLDELLADSVKLQLRSDVPNGVFLSSGLDSATIAYYASRVSNQKVKTFTIHFAEESYSEREGAKAIAERCGTEHFEILLNPNIEEIVLKMVDFFDEPFADTSAIPTYLLCQFVRKQITVALSGEGGDELFAGYPTYIATQMARHYKNIPSPMRAVLRALTHQLPVSWERISWDYKLKQFVDGAEFPIERTHFAWKEIFTEEEKQRLYSRDFLRQKNGHDGFESFRRLFELVGNGVELEKLLFVDQNSYLLDQFLVKSDRMSMAHALEVRVPILDHRIIELAQEIPAKYKLRGFSTKWTLRKLMEGKLPEEILSASKKGFSPPIPFWLAGTLKPFLLKTLSRENIARIGFLNYDYVSKLIEEHMSKKRDNHRRLWTILNFVLWHDKWAV